MENTDVKKTTLHTYHVEQGAHMALFGGYDMPLWYPVGAKAEHLAVVESAGIFDTSHMSVLTVQGAGSRAVLQHCFTKDLERAIGPKKLALPVGRCVYGLFLLEDGSVLDDALVYMLAENSYMVVVNAGMGGSVVSHLENHAADGVDIADCTASVGKMDLQGPFSAVILKKIIKNPEDLFAPLPYFSFKGGTADCPTATEVELLDGTSFMVSRTGYTGEFGFEFFIEREKLVQLWQIVLAAGAEYGLIACGLASRDSLRAGAVLPLSHQDIGAWPFTNTPWPFALPYGEDGNFTKDFVGADVVSEPCTDDFTYPFAGFDPRKIQVEEDTVVVDDEGETIGHVLTCTTDMAIGRVDGQIYSITSPVEKGCPQDFSPRGLSCGFIRVTCPLEIGDEVTLRCGKRKIKVEIRGDIRPDRTARKAAKSMLLVEK
ncbi:aminomethyltransferase family protein [Desulfotalea psychrophila]|uniref:Related to glycine cleavage system, T protein n=1 Tax=Desulfotalea psychrophila (strain LSv54 / DSM 12343) TaxID=177439 RepID=Q6ARJ5_DESPS|nr:aminomethyltransferase family protein [Desulfotalea psychrophila]CAG35030.1 related to glycine cleavage system, T protein [Desulfotalea psychrophila LSv54]